MPLRWWLRELLARRAEYVAQVRAKAEAMKDAPGGWAQNLTQGEIKTLLSLEEDW